METTCQLYASDRNGPVERNLQHDSSVNRTAWKWKQKLGYIMVSGDPSRWPETVTKVSRTFTVQFTNKLRLYIASVYT